MVLKLIFNYTLKIFFYKIKFKELSMKATRIKKYIIRQQNIIRSIFLEIIISIL